MTKPQPQADYDFDVSTFDARAWAEEFIRIYRFEDNSKRIDVDWMQTWFASAIMAGFDEANRRRARLSKLRQECMND